MSIQLWLSFTLATFLITLSPGPSVMLVISTTISRGYKKGFVALAGLQTGDMIWAMASVAAILSSYKASAGLLGVIGLIGAVYLGYLGLASFIPMPDFFAFLDFRKRLSTERTRGAKRPSVFLTGLMTQLANPKVYLYWMALLPQFQPARGPTLEHNVWLILIGVMCVMMIHPCYIYAATKARHFFIDEKWRRLLDHLSGSVLIGLSLWMLAHHFDLV